jgi:phosphomannomutase
MATMELSLQESLLRLAAAQSEGNLSASALENLRAWLTAPRYAAYVAEIVAHVAAGRWKELDDAFWTTIPFGTGGRRGKLYPIGSNTINDRTIGESAQGLADYVKRCAGPGPFSCAVAYDTRHRSREFAELCSEIMVAAGFTVFFLDGFRSTPELSFAVRHKRCSCGIMITASHNPPSDNAVKVYWSTGGQLLPPHDRGVIDQVMAVDAIARVPFHEATADGRIVFCQEEIDAAFIRAVVSQSCPGPRDLRIVYSPLHGVGGFAVLPALEAAGFRDVESFGPHSEPHPDFPNVPNHISNPEKAIVFDAIIEHARRVEADLVMATDPDCDRLGAAAPLSTARGAPWATLTGNQIGALLTDYLLDAARRAGRLRADHYVVKTLVTTELIRRIADGYGVRTIGDLLVGFKYIGGVIDDEGPQGFLLGAEESYGFLVGVHARDKDGAVAAMLLAELAARAKASGLSLHQKLESLFARYGCHAERTISLAMPGSEGMTRMKALLARLRAEPPSSLGGIPVARRRDYLTNTAAEAGGAATPLAGPTGDLLFFDLALDGNCVAARPSGTEPLVKFYMFAYDPPERIVEMARTRAELERRLDALERDLRALV